MSRRDSHLLVLGIGSGERFDLLKSRFEVAGEEGGIGEVGGVEGGDLFESTEIDGLGDDGIDGVAIWRGEVRGHGHGERE